jgi:hypothetical protein
MTPVVNGLYEEYQAQIEFVSINAADGEGKNTFQAYGLVGHPSYLVLSPEGEVLWQAAGPQSRENIEAALMSSLAKTGSN